MQLIRDASALRKSWRTYHSSPESNRSLDAHYASFVKSGDLVFDVGAHVGHRTASFLRLGARVVAVEPQPLAALLIRTFWGWRGATVEQVACGAAEGAATMRLNSRNPAVSSLSPSFIAAAEGAPEWSRQSWDRTRKVRITTLDSLIARHGAPAFVKIDVEGYEQEALAGLTRPVPRLSFEFTTIQREAARACVLRCLEIGLSRFNVVVGETHRFRMESWVGANEMNAWLTTVPDDANSGDVYASL